LDGVVLKVVNFICSNYARVVDEFVLETLLKVDRATVASILGALVADGYLSEVSTGSPTCSSCPLSELCLTGSRAWSSMRVYLPTARLKKLCETLLQKS